MKNFKTILAIVYIVMLAFFSYQYGESRGFDRGWDKGSIRKLENPDYLEPAPIVYKDPMKQAIFEAGYDACQEQL